MNFIKAFLICFLGGAVLTAVVALLIFGMGLAFREGPLIQFLITLTLVSLSGAVAIVLD